MNYGQDSGIKLVWGSVKIATGRTVGKGCTSDGVEPDLVVQAVSSRISRKSMVRWL